jgi:hypothetical membrane protein
VAAPGLVEFYAPSVPASLRPWRVLSAVALASVAVLVAAGFAPQTFVVPLWGNWSVGALTAAGAAAAAAILAFHSYTTAATGIAPDAPLTLGARLHRGIDALAASVAYALIAGLVVALAFIVIDLLTAGSAVSLLQATVGGAIALIAVGVLVRRSARGTATSRAVRVLMILIALGCLTAIATTPDPLWWQLHFSRLGTFQVFSGYVFNGTLIATGALIVAFSLRVRREIERLGGLSVLANHRRAAKILPVLVALVGAHLALVGFIPVNVLEFWHDRAATGMVLAFAGMLATAPWLLRGMDRKLFRATGIVTVVLVIGATIFIMGVINLAAFEVIAFGLMFWWIGVFAGCAESSIHPAPRASPATARAMRTGRRAADTSIAAPAPARRDLVIPRRIRRVTTSAHALSVSRPRARVAYGVTAERVSPSAALRTPNPSRRTVLRHRPSRVTTNRRGPSPVPRRYGASRVAA